MPDNTDGTISRITIMLDRYSVRHLPLSSQFVLVPNVIYVYELKKMRF